MTDATGMGPNSPAPRLDPNCQCICHTQPGVMHVAACCQAPAQGADLMKAEPATIFPDEWSCTAWEDCQHDGICHDPKNCEAIGPNHQAFYGLTDEEPPHDE